MSAISSCTDQENRLPAPPFNDALFSYISDGLLAINEEYEVTYINDAAQRFLKLKEKGSLSVGENIINWSIKNNQALLLKAIQECKTESKGECEKQFYNAHTLKKLQLKIFENFGNNASHTVLLISPIEEELSDIVHSIGAIVWEADPLTLNITFVSDQAEQVLGYPLSVWYEPGFWSKYLHPEDVEGALRSCSKAIAKGQDHTLEYRMIAKDGTIKWFKDVVRLIKEENKVVAIRGLLIDITREKEAARQLAASEELFKAIVNYSLDAVALLSEEMEIRFVSPSVSSILGFTPAELIGKYALELVPEDQQPEAVERFGKVLAETSVENIPSAELYMLHKNGTRLLVEMLGQNYSNNAYLKGIMISFRDITERKRLETELATAQATQQKKIINAVIKTQEAERSKIAKELHDNINQLLSAAKLMIDTAKDREELREKMLYSSSDVIRQAITEIRALSSSLVVYDIQDLGICESVQKLVSFISIAASIKATAKVELRVEKALDNASKTHLYRIIQEHLTNVQKHAKATRVLIKLQLCKDQVKLSIKDNGVGFNTNKKKGGIGLSNISGRVQILGGNFTIKSKPGEGCALLVAVPVVTTEF